MFGKILFLAILFSTVACARPNSAVQEGARGALEVQTPSALADCTLKFANSPLCLSWQWEAKPTSAKSGAMVFKVFRPNAYDKTPVLTDVVGVVELVLWMPGMGHGSLPTAIERLDVGTYRAINVFFVMPGKWELKFQIKENETVVDEIITGLTI